MELFALVDTKEYGNTCVAMRVNAHRRGVSMRLLEQGKYTGGQANSNRVSPACVGRQFVIIKAIFVNLIVILWFHSPSEARRDERNLTNDSQLLCRLNRWKVSHRRLL